jgi:type IV pilus assembly protein PilO
MAGLPTNQRDQLMLVVCVLAAAAVWGYWNYLWKPKRAELVIVQARLDSLNAQNEIAQREVASGNVARLRQEAEEYGRVLAVMRQLVPVENEVPTLLDQISTAARRTGLDLGDILPLGVIPGDIFDTHRYQLGLAGPYHRIARFLNNVGSLTRIVAPMNVNMLPSERAARQARAGERLLNVTLEIQTFVAKTAPPAVAGGSGQ